MPDVDQSRHSIPLAEVYVDTFRNVDRALPLDRADRTTVVRLRDAIPPNHDPRYPSAAEAD